MDNTKTKKEINSVTGIRVKKQFRDAIATDAVLQGKLAKTTNKSWITIYRWVTNNDEKLTMLSILNAIRQHLNLPADMELTEEL